MYILHLTDLHFRPGSPFQEALTAALLSDLQQEIAAGRKPDVLVFSGDLVASPDEIGPDETGPYESFLWKFLVPVLEVIGLAYDRVVLCPGNHDVSWAAMRANQLTYETLQARSGDQDYLSSGSSKVTAHGFQRVSLP